jgi:hypothetical protein
LVPLALRLLLGVVSCWLMSSERAAAQADRGPRPDRARHWEFAAPSLNGWHDSPSRFDQFSKPWASDPNDKLLDDSLRRTSDALAAIDREPEFPAAIVTFQPDNRGSSLAEAPLSFYLMGLTSAVLAVWGLVVVLRHRPALGELRGQNETSSARRSAIRCIAVLMVLNLADLWFTAFLAPCRAFVELNPLADLILDSLPMLIALKLGVVGGCAALLLRFWRYKVVQFASWTAATIYTGLAIWWVAYFRAAVS